MRHSQTLRSLTLTLALTAAIHAQPQSTGATAVPRLIRFNSSYPTASQPPSAGAIGATFSIYSLPGGKKLRRRSRS